MEQGTETYGGRILIDNNAYRAVLGAGIEDARINGTLLGLEPFVSTKGDKYTVRVGAGMFLDVAEARPHSISSRRPTWTTASLTTSWSRTSGWMAIAIRNSFRSLTQQNPWLGGAPNIANSSLMYDLYGGLRGSFSSDIGFDVRISNSRMKARPLVHQRRLSGG